MTTDCKRCKGWYNPCAPDDYPDYVDDPDNCAYFERREGDVMTNQEREDFRAAARPLMEWMRINWHPHTVCIVTAETAKLMEGLVAVERR